MAPRSKPVFFVCPTDDNAGCRSGQRSKIPMYAARRKRRRARSLAQNEEHAKFSFVTAFMSPFKELHRLAFISGSGNITGKDLAFRCVSTAIDGSQPNFIIDYSRLLVASGSLRNAANPIAIASSPGVIHFFWSVDSLESSASNDDQALLVAYCPAKHQVIFNTAAALRTAWAATLDVGAFEGYSVHTWLSFLNAKSNNAAASGYTGAVMVKRFLNYIDP